MVKISKRIGAQRYSEATGIKIGMTPLCGKVITEVQALTLLGAEDVFPIGAGGINGGEGSITLCVIGEKVDDIFDIVWKIKEKKQCNKNLGKYLYMIGTNISSYSYE